MPVGNLNEMFDAIFACWVPPKDTEALVVTLQFILQKDGRIRDKVVVIAARPQEDSPRRRAFIESAIEAEGGRHLFPLPGSLEAVSPAGRWRRVLSV